jgi:hypothetical protein
MNKEEGIAIFELGIVNRCEYAAESETMRIINIK